jgi:hypothetical protein
MSRGAVETFLRTLILGDFEEHQSTSAQIVSGLLGLIPGLDQVLDARDIAGTLFNINKSGGFKNATPDQLVNLGFAAFGAIPEVGSVFKATFKPLYRERKLAKGAVHSGLHKLESMLGMSKGGALTWIRKELLGKWAQRTNQVIQTVNSALNSAIELIEFMAYATGWKDWLIPDPIQELCKQLLPGLKAMRGTLNAPLQRASDEIRHFLEDLLGEQAAGVVMALGNRAVQPSAVPGTRTRAGHNAAAVAPKGPVPVRQQQRKVAGTPATKGTKAQGPISRAIQVTRKTIGTLANQEKALLGEHIVDYHELKRLGGNWPHDKKTGKWLPTTVAKLNCDKRPMNLSLEDLPKVNIPGIDAVWGHDGKFTVTEAKASPSIGTAYGGGLRKQGSGSIPKVTGLSPDLQLLHALLSDSSDKRGTQTPLMQMSKAWVRDRAPAEKTGLVATAAMQNDQAARRVAFVTIESAGGLDHVEAFADIHLGVAAAKVHPHVNHGITREWEAAAIDAVDRARKDVHEAKGKATKSEGPAEKTKKPRKPRK